MAEDIVQPKEGVTAAPEVVPNENAPKAKAGAFPDELLQIPAMQALFAGAPPALSASLADFAKRPETKLITGNKEALMKAGIGLYRSLAGDTGVLFNQLHINGEDLIQADKEGRLLEVAPPFDSINEATSKSGDQNPVISASVPGGPKTATPALPASPSPSAGGNQPAAVETQTNAARIKNLSPGGPTTGMSPGAGRVLNTILKPVI